MDQHFRYSAQLLDAHGAPLAEEPIEPDWGAAIGSAHLEGVRRGVLPALTDPGVAHVQPRWDEAAGAPWIAGVQIRLASTAGDEFRFDATLEYFADHASAAASRLVERGELQQGAQFLYRVSAFAAAPPAGEPGVAPRSRREPLPIVTARFATQLARGEQVRPDERAPEDLPVLLPRRLLDEAGALAARDPCIETAGILVGRLEREPDSGELAIGVTALIPAQHTDATRESVRFTPQSWAAADAAIALRGGRETLIGWFHSHPHFCRDCDEQRRRVCPLSRPVFSRDDQRVHRVAFPRAWQVALLGSFLGEPLPRFDLFGWRRGVITARAFVIVERATPQLERARDERQN